MGRPASIFLNTQRLHAELIAAFGADARMSRDTFDGIVMKSLCCGYPQAQNLIRTGESLGLWVRVKPSNPSAGCGHVVLKAVLP